MITVRTLGKAEIQIGRRKLTPKTETLFALGLHLCARAGERLTRDELAAMFWPDATITRARHSLRQMLYRLRQSGLAVGERAEDLHLQAELVRFDHAEVLAPTELDASAPIAPPPDLTLLPGHRGAFSASYAQWLDGYRASVAARIRRVLNDRMQHLRRHGRWDDVQTVAEAILKTDSLNEEAMLALAESVVMTGSKALAVGMLDRFVEDLGPGSSRLALPATLLRRRISETSADWQRVAEKTPKLVGRTRELAVLISSLENVASGASSSIIVTGPAGIGKTRLCAELQLVANLRGFRWLQIHCDPASGQLPLATASQLLDSLWTIPGAAAASPAAIAVLTRLRDDNNASRLLKSDSNLRNEELVWALGEVLGGIADERKVVVAIDDLQNVDHLSRAVIDGLVQHCIPSNTLLLATARTSGRRQPWQGWSTALSLGALSDEDSLTLAGILTSTHGDRHHIARIARQSGGNPLFIRELAAMDQNPRPDVPLPSTLRKIIDARMRTLSNSQIRFLRLAALLESDSTLERICRLMPTPHEPLSEIVEALESEGIVHLRSHGRLQLHECWLSGVLDALPPVSRAALAFEAARTLHDTTYPSNDSAARWRAASLYRDAGSISQARALYTDLGTTLLDRGLCEGARHAFSAAREMAESPEDKANLCERLAASCVRTGAYSEAEKLARQGLELHTLVRRADPSTRVRLLAHLIDAQSRASDGYLETFQLLIEAVADTRASDESRRYAAFRAMRVAVVNVLTSEAHVLWEAVLETNRRSEPSLYGELARLVFLSEHGRVGELPEVISSLIYLESKCESVDLIVQSIHYRANAERWFGNVSTARRLGEEAWILAKENGLLVQSVLVGEWMAFLNLDWSDTDEAERWLDRAHEIEIVDSIQSLRVSRRHLRARFLLQRGRADAAFDMCADDLNTAAQDGLVSRRVNSLATAALAAALCGNETAYRQVAPTIEESLPGVRSALAFDYAVECLLRGDAALGSERALDVARQYIAGRDPTSVRPFASSLTFLLAVERGANANEIASLSPSSWPQISAN